MNRSHIVPASVGLAFALACGGAGGLEPEPTVAPEPTTEPAPSESFMPTRIDAREGSLCTADETVAFTCTLDGGSLPSVCRVADVVVVRKGRADALDHVYPWDDQPAPTWADAAQPGAVGGSIEWVLDDTLYAVHHVLDSEGKAKAWWSALADGPPKNERCTAFEGDLSALASDLGH